MFYLQVRDARGERDVALPSACVIRVGRAGDSDVVLEGDDVSRCHAELRTGKAGVEIQDLDTPNGTWLVPAGTSATRPTRVRIASSTWTALSVGDELRVGGAASLVLRDAVGPEAERASASATRDATAGGSFAARLDTLRFGEGATPVLLALVALALDLLGTRVGSEAAAAALGRLVAAIGCRRLDVVERGGGGLRVALSSEATRVGTAPAGPGADLAREAMGSGTLETRWDAGCADAWLAAPMTPDAALLATHDGAGASPAPETVRVLQAAAAIVAHFLAEQARGAGGMADRDERDVGGVGGGALRHYKGHVLSAALRDVLEVAARAALASQPVLLLGETGVGKELVAQFLHDASGRRGRFVAVNLAAVPPGLLESELLGHVRGAFTGATTDRKGAFREADEGTLFLDEIGEVPLDLQPKLLRVLEDGVVRPVGSDHSQTVRVRLVAASNRDLAAEAHLGRFRADLYYRLAAVSLRVPPLRERVEEILPLARTFLAAAATEGGPPKAFDRDAVRWMLAHSWPGNVRELRNRVLGAVVLAPGGFVRPAHLGAADLAATVPDPLALPWQLAQEAFERAYFERLLRAHAWNVAEVARMAETDRGNVYKKMRARGLEPPPESGGNESPEDLTD